MKKNRLEKIVTRIALIGAVASDSDELKLQKSLLVLCTFPFIIAGAGWGIMYMLFGEVLAGLIPFAYGVFSLASVSYFKFSRKFEVFRFSQLLLILLLPFALLLSLGGFVNGSVVILWSLISPLGAMLFYKRSVAPWWLLAFVVLVVISTLVQPWIRFQNNLTAWQINLFFVINLSAVGSLIFMMVYYFVGKKNFFQVQSEALLLNILPKEIAAELKANGHAAAKHFESVTIMFTDFKNFTQLSERLTPAALVAEIDRLFKAFDRIISKYAIEKIKTIGDSYMCAGGLPVATTTHAYDVVRAALEIRQFMQYHLQQCIAAGNEPFEIRIGIHTGAVVAGIVGATKFAYDIWGDAVNIASRMESSGEAGKINISGSTYALIKEGFCCTYRGMIEAKHKGAIAMYFVEGTL